MFIYFRSIINFEFLLIVTQQDLVQQVPCYYIDIFLLLC